MLLKFSLVIVNYLIIETNIAMLQKTYDIEVTDLVEKARPMINTSSQHNFMSFIPYVDEQYGEIRYLKFSLINDNWIYTGSTENIKESFA